MIIISKRNILRWLLDIIVLGIFIVYLTFVIMLMSGTNTVFNIMHEQALKQEQNTFQNLKSANYISTKDASKLFLSAKANHNNKLIKQMNNITVTDDSDGYTYKMEVYETYASYNYRLKQLMNGKNPAINQGWLDENITNIKRKKTKHERRCKHSRRNRSQKESNAK